MPKKIDYHKFIGCKFNKLTVLDVKDDYLICKCDCGNVKKIKRQNVIHGETKSCGCIRGRTKKYKIIENPRIYRIWNCMRNRCKTNKHYTSKHISVCESWKNDYKTFEKWALSSGYSDNLTIDRIDVYGNYEPSNCRWVDCHMQIANTGMLKNNKSGFKGVCFDKSLSKWRSDITVRGERYYLGTFDTIELAWEARCEFIKQFGLMEYRS